MVRISRDEPLIRTSSDARALSRNARPLIPSPSSFEGTLSDLTQRFIIPNLPDPGSVATFHRALVEYTGQDDALFLLRALPNTERRQVYSVKDGTRFKATDNAPAWWIHATLLQGWSIADGAFADVVATMPAHIHDVKNTCPPTASDAGWHIAHIFDVNNRDTDYSRFSRREIIRRFVRSVHPCNYFLVPKPDWPRWGGDARVIGYFSALYSERYAEVWSDFLRLADASNVAVARSLTPIEYKYDAAAVARTPPATRQTVAGPSGTVPIPSAKGTLASGVPTYRASRLTFKRDVIEPLVGDAVFRVITPIGTFVMTKDEMYQTFPGVPRSASYREAGYYNYRTLPQSAEQFRISD